MKQIIMKYLRPFLIILAAGLMLAAQDKELFSDFIYDQLEEAGDNSGETVKKEDEKYAKYIARNIKAEVVPDIKGAVRISWGVHRNSDEDYIVGRSAVVPDSMDKALKSISIKVVPAGAKTEVIDSNLRSGTYYYCVLAKSRIIDRDIALFADQNYTINGVVVENEPVKEAEKILPQQVSLIYARVINNTQVRLTWRGIESRGIAYTVYRANAALDAPEKISKAEKIKVITDGMESCTDTINKSGTYFYAVTTKDISGNEDLNLIPDQSFTVSGVYITLEVPAPVKNIAAKSGSDGIRISWEANASGVSEYLVYRYSNAISDSERLSLATFIGRTAGKENYYIDKTRATGNYYYAVLTKFMNGKVLNDLVKGGNFTAEPVVTGSRVALVSISARADGNNIELNWKISGNLGSKSYRILRRESAIKSRADLDGADVVAYVNVDDLNYTDKNLDPGKYYYALVPESIEEKEFSLDEGVNVVEKTVLGKKEEKTEAKAPEEIMVPEIADEPEIIAAPEITAPVPAPPMVIEKEETAGKKEQKTPAGKTASRTDNIIKKYFIPGKYKSAIDELRIIAKNPDNKYEAAKAKLFIGRSLIELKKYKESLDYLGLKDVIGHFPRESGFWREYAMSKIAKNENYILKDGF